MVHGHLKSTRGQVFITGRAVSSIHFNLFIHIISYMADNIMDGYTGFYDKIHMQSATHWCSNRYVDDLGQRLKIALLESPNRWWKKYTARTTMLYIYNVAYRTNPLRTAWSWCLHVHVPLSSWCTNVAVVSNSPVLHLCMILTLR